MTGSALLPASHAIGGRADGHDEGLGVHAGAVILPERAIRAELWFRRRASARASAPRLTCHSAGPRAGAAARASGRGFAPGPARAG